jgi:putative endonuclease
MYYSYLYMLTNASRTYLYVGSTNDLSEAISEHRHTTCSSFSKEIQPIHLIYFETFQDLKLAEMRALEVRSWKERQKWKLVMNANPCLSELLWLHAETLAA